MCLVCGATVAVMKKANIERHYRTKHANYVQYSGDERIRKVQSLKNSFRLQGNMFTKGSHKATGIVHASYIISELIAKKLKEFSDGEFVKECLVAAAEVLCPEKKGSI